MADAAKYDAARGAYKATPEELAKVTEFLATCPYIRHSPTAKDALLVRGDDGKKTVRVPRLISEVSYLRLHKLCKQAKGITMGERTWYKCMAAIPNLRRMTARR